jgi:sirohydrochlorin ferrochelatase
MPVAVIIVDHGSRSGESNALLHDLVRQFAHAFGQRYSIVEPAHMELAEPTIADAYARCATRGAEEIIVCPFFLGPGKHWQSDIPSLAAKAAAQFPQTAYRVAAPLGVDELMLRLLDKRIAQSLTREMEPQT